MKNQLSHGSLNFIIENAEGNLYWKNRKLQYLGCNKNFLKVTGLESLNSIIGKTDSDLFSNLLSKDKLDKIYKNDVYVIENKKTILIEELGLDERGNKACYITKKSPLYDDKNELIGLIGTSIDITAKKQLKESKEKQKELEKKSLHTKQAAGSIAHDLRTPLASIQAAMVGIKHNLPRLIDGYEKAKEAGLHVERVRKDSLEALKKLTESCNSEILFSNQYINLVLANLSADEIRTESYKKQFVANLIEDSVKKYPCNLRQRALINLNLNQDFKFLGESTYLKNMINNLMKNALYYIEEARKGEIFIKTHSDTEGDYNYLSFKDTAKGAPPEILQSMFNGFYSKRSGGTGLGLTFCKNVMQSFGGDIEARSVEGEYMEFLLSFPKLS